MKLDRKKETTTKVNQSKANTHKTVNLSSINCDEREKNNRILNEFHNDDFTITKPDQVTEITLGQILTDFKRLHFMNFLLKKKETEKRWRKCVCVCVFCLTSECVLYFVYTLKMQFYDRLFCIVLHT